jgi:hypothetical protein
VIEPEFVLELLILLLDRLALMRERDELFKAVFARFIAPTFSSLAAIPVWSTRAAPLTLIPAATPVIWCLAELRAMPTPDAPLDSLFPVAVDVSTLAIVAAEGTFPAVRPGSFLQQCELLLWYRLGFWHRVRRLGF